MANHQVTSRNSAPVRRAPHRGVPPARRTAAKACCPPADPPGTVRARVAAGVAGSCGSLACIASMVLPLVGLAGAGAAAGAQATGGSMAGMGPAPTSTSTATAASSTASSHPGGVLGFLVTIGPELLVVSVLLVTVSLALRRRVAAVPALAAGALLYWGMYAQASVGLMYATIAVGYLVWVATYAWTRVSRSRASLAGLPAL